MVKTQVADIIVPSIFEQYAIERTAELSNFGQCGIVQSDPFFDELASGGGQTVAMPFWQDLGSGSRQLLSDSATLTSNKITGTQDIARIQNDAQVWSVNDLAHLLSGSDPMQAIVNFVAAYWARIDEGLVVSSLVGMFGAASMVNNLLAIHSESIGNANIATKLTGLTFIDACAKLGDRSDLLTAVAMHSATEAALRKQDLIDFIPHSNGVDMLRYFQGRRVVVNDHLPVRAGTTDGNVYTTFLFCDGAFAKGAATLDGEPLQAGTGTQGIELARVPLDSDTVLINRRRYILHPRGVKFTSSSVAGDTPTNAELAAAANWTRVFEAKNVRIVAVTHNN